MQSITFNTPQTEPGTQEGFKVGEHVCPVVSNEWVNDRYKHLVLEAPERALSVEAGQFFHLLCPSSKNGNPFLRRPMSVYQADRKNERIEFLYKCLGAGTHGMAILKPDDTFNIVGPLGIGFTVNPAWHHIAVLGRGVGLATLAPLARMAANLGVRVTAILSAQKQDYLMSQDVFDAAGARVITVTDEEGTSAVDNVKSILKNQIARDHVDGFFTCGSNRLMLIMKELGAKYEIPGQVALEQQMACGLGMCFCCVRSFEVGEEVLHRRVCCEGPVFDMQEALSW
ncbi:dihydroorotate dehydrogenase electron transfer subunit [Alphaproteobacteria bacterium]|nr:dihydroorotate dehydrogenase electron transfer subunit [Alphaproteobacteria bacterium]